MLKVEEYEKVKMDVVDALKCLNEIELYCGSVDKSFDIGEADQALLVINQMTKKYLEILKKEIPRHKVISCPNCNMEVKFEEVKCPWCGQVFV